MVTINANVNGALEYFKRNEDMTYCIKILGEDGLFHIYDKLVRACKTPDYKAGDYIGESEELNYVVRNHFLKSI